MLFFFKVTHYIKFLPHIVPHKHTLCPTFGLLESGHPTHTTTQTPTQTPRKHKKTKVLSSEARLAKRECDRRQGKLESTYHSETLAH